MNMNREDAEEATQALGQICAGSWRTIALYVRLGVPEALGLTTREWVEQRLGGYVRFSIPEERKAASAELVAEGMTQRQAADVLGVSQKTIDRDLELFDSEHEGEAPTEDAGAEARESNDSPEPEPPDLFGDDDSVLVELEGEDDRLAARERDARLILLVSKAQAAVAPVTTAQEAIEGMLARLDRDRLDLLVPSLDRAAQTLAALAERSRAIQQKGPRLVSGGRR